MYSVVLMAAMMTTPVTPETVHKQVAAAAAVSSELRLQRRPWRCGGRQARRRRL